MPCSGLGHDKSLRGENERLEADLAAARRERESLLELLAEALSIPAHGKGCPELRDAGPCDCWVSDARAALEKANG